MTETITDAAAAPAARRLRLATVWLDGCSGCHMSLLDLDERLIEVFAKVDLVYSPLVDTKEFPDEVDICLVEGAVASDEDLEKIKHVRAHTKTLVSFGDCAVTANVPSMRNPIGTKPLLERAYIENATLNQRIPNQVIPTLLPHARSVHRVVHVDVFLPGCPPSADLIYAMLVDLIEGREPEYRGARFGR